MSLIDVILAQLAPHECLNCNKEGSLLCVRCRQFLEPVDSECYRCQKPTREFATCPACRRYSALVTVKPATPYLGIAKDLVWKLKFDGARAAATVMADKMQTFLIENNDWQLLPVPTANSRARQRGYDQAILLARSLSKLSGLPVQNNLLRFGSMHQLGADRQSRLRQLQGAFAFRRPETIQGKRIILVDDVVTTGATLEAAALALKQAGAKSIEAVVFARA